MQSFMRGLMELRQRTDIIICSQEEASSGPRLQGIHQCGHAYSIILPSDQILSAHSATCGSPYFTAVRRRYTFPPSTALRQILLLSQLHPLALAHCSTSRWQLLAALIQVVLSQGHPLSLNHLRTSRWPPLAAWEHVRSSHLHPLAIAHLTTSRWPLSAAQAQV